jgi:hypothetical protein
MSHPENKVKVNVEALGVLLLVAIAVWVFWLIAAIYSRTPLPMSDDWTFAANRTCYDYVLTSLPTPATAVFSSFFGSAWQVDKPVMDSSQRWLFTVRSYVDYQNQFGALVRSRFTCLAAYQSETDWQKLAVELQPWNTQPRWITTFRERRCSRRSPVSCAIRDSREKCYLSRTTASASAGISCRASTCGSTVRGDPSSLVARAGRKWS